MQILKVLPNGALFLLLALTATTAAAQDAHPVLRDILNELDSTLSGQLPWVVHGTIQLTNGGSVAKIATDRAELRYIYRRDANRLDVEMQTYKPGDPAGQPSDQNRSIAGPSPGLFYSRDGTQPPREVVARPNSKAAIDVARSRLAGAEAMDGYVAQDFASLVQVIRDSDSSVDPLPEEIDGHSCFVVRSKGRHGRYVAYLDPSIGFLPRKIEVLKAGDDAFNNKKLSDVAFSTANGKQMVLTSDEFEMDHVAAEQMSGHWIMTGASTREVQTYSNGKTLNITRVHRRDQIDLNPDFAKLDAFRPDIPDGTRVLFDDPIETGLAYEWRGGKVLPKVDVSEVGGIERSISDFKATGKASDGVETSESEHSDSSLGIGNPWLWSILLLAGCGTAALVISLFVSGRAPTKSGGGRAAL